MFTVNIQKGGAMLDDTRRVIEVWDDGVDPPTNMRRIGEANLLGKVSRKRANDVLLRIIGPRYVAPGPEVIPALRSLADDPKAFREACFYETARDEQLLAAFAEGPIFQWYSERKDRGHPQEVKGLAGVAHSHGPTARVDRHRPYQGRARTSRGAARLRRTQRSSPQRILLARHERQGFAYVAFRVHESGRLLTGAAGEHHMAAMAAGRPMGH